MVQEVLLHHPVFWNLDSLSDPGVSVESPVPGFSLDDETQGSRPMTGPSKFTLSTAGSIMASYSLCMLRLLLPCYPVLAKSEGHDTEGGATEAKRAGAGDFVV